MSEQPNQAIILEFSEEIQARLSELDIDIIRELQNHGLEVQRTSASDPLAAEGAKSASVAFALVGVGATVFLVCAGVRKIIEPILRHKEVVHESWTLTPVVHDGEIVESDGRPVLYWRQTAELLGPPEPSPSSEVTEITATPLKITFSTKTERKK